MKEFVIENNWITLAQLDQVINSCAEVKLSESVKADIQKCREYLDDKVRVAEERIYGVNTGFGSLCNTAIEEKDLEKLQRNLVESHACGTGERVPDHIVKRMLLLKAIGLSHGR